LPVDSFRDIPLDMVTAYVGIISLRGLEVYCREEEHTTQFLLQRLRRLNSHQAGCIWFVMDSQFETVLCALLASDHNMSAWSFVRDAAREVGTVMEEGNAPHQSGEYA
jgi:hypothetical protein